MSEIFLLVCILQIRERERERERERDRKIERERERERVITKKKIYIIEKYFRVPSLSVHFVYI